MVAVTLFGQRLQLSVLVIPHPVTENRQKNAALTLLRDQPFQFRLARNADVEIPVRTKDHPVVTAVDKTAPSQVVSLLNPRAAGRRTAGLELFERVPDFLFFAARHGLQNRFRTAAVSNDADAVFVAQVVDQQLHRRNDEPESVGAVHRSRNIDQEHEVGRGQSLGSDLPRLDADPHQPVRLVPRANPGFGRNSHRIVPFGFFITVGEIIDHFLDPHRVLRRRLTLADHAPEIAVRSSVHVDRKGGQRFGLRRTEPIFGKGGVRFAVSGNRRGQG